METLFASYVLSVLGKLPPEKDAVAVEVAPRLQAALKTRASEWKAIVSESLHLSDTIELAVLDLWYTNADRATAAGTALDPEAFAAAFVEKYAEEGSTVDVWPGDSLARARERVAARRG
jgi:hypothetical protein